VQLLLLREGRDVGVEMIIENQSKIIIRQVIRQHDRKKFGEYPPRAGIHKGTYELL